MTYLTVGDLVVTDSFSDLGDSDDGSSLNKIMAYVRCHFHR